MSKRFSNAEVEQNRGSTPEKKKKRRKITRLEVFAVEKTGIVLRVPRSMMGS
jgi:hypothetical protein